jgi:hypothetical protein
MTSARSIEDPARAGYGVETARTASKYCSAPVIFFTAMLDLIRGTNWKRVMGKHKE